MDVQAVSASDGPQQAAPAAVAAAAPQESAPAQHAPDARAGVAPAVSKLFGHDLTQSSEHLRVSYHVENHPYKVVTVFTDPTGREVAQFPPDVMRDFAQLFDLEQGATLDQDA